MRQKNKTFPDSILENQLINSGYSAVIGIDEVGRGCWAGPVYLGAFIYTNTTEPIPGINDSKLLTPKQREKFHSAISSNQNSYHIEVGEIELINKVGIGRTISDLIEKMLEKFKNSDVYFLIDGYFTKNFGKNTRQIVRGDMKHYSISAASVIAKYERDQYMVDIAKKYPNWGFDLHKGYGTKIHQDALTKYGVSEIHRRNYKPIIKILQEK